MTTPDTSDVRAWARKQGIAVSDRGRLSAELREAYLASLDASPATAAAAKDPALRVLTKQAPAKKAAAKQAPAKKVPAKQAAAVKAAPAAAATTATAPARRARPAAKAVISAPSISATPAAKPADKPVIAEVPETPEARMIRLEERLTALTARVATLEQPAPAKPNRFRLRSN